MSLTSRPSFRQKKILPAPPAAHKYIAGCAARLNRLFPARADCYQEEMIAYRTDELPHNARRYASSFAAPPRSAEPVLRADTGAEPDWETGAFASLKQPVLDSAARIAASPFIMRKDSVRGFVFDVETGRAPRDPL
jgi:hypothetical protein